MTPQMLKKLKQKINSFEQAVRDHDNKGSQDIEFHDSIQINYEVAKAELFEIVEKYTREKTK